jgi:hypothetical protein
VSVIGTGTHILLYQNGGSETPTVFLERPTEALTSGTKFIPRLFLMPLQEFLVIAVHLGREVLGLWKEIVSVVRILGAPMVCRKESVNTTLV